MVEQREVRLRFIGAKDGGFDPDAAPDRTVTYTGAPVTVTRR